MTNMNLLWLTPASREFLNNDYLVNGQTPEDRIIEIADTVEKYLAGRPRSRVMRWFTRDRKIDFRERFLHGMSRGWCSLSTPIWTNFGKSRGLPISCYGGFCADTMEGITSHWAEVSIQTANGGGTSGYHGAIRPRGHTIKDNGKSSGPYEFLRIPSALMRVVSQGRARRGNYAAYMPVEHPDILEFLSILDDQSPLNNLFPGVCISDEWFESMLNGDKDKRRVWVTILEYRKTKSKPFLLFSSTVNRNKPDVYKDKNIPIWASNLCVTGDQRVVSDRGLKTAKELCEEGGNLRLFDNDKVVNASPMKLIERNADVYKITLANGMTHTATGYHKVKTKTEYISTVDGSWLTADKEFSRVKLGDLVAVQTRQGLFGTNSTSQPLPKKLHDNLPSWVWTANEKTQWEFVDNLFAMSGAGSVYRDTKEPFQLVLPSDSLNLLRELQILLTNLGLHPLLPKKLSDESSWAIALLDRNQLSFVGSEQSKYHLLINNKNDLIRLKNCTSLLNNKEIVFPGCEYDDHAEEFSEVESIEYVGKQDVYCCTIDSEEHHWVCNGIITHNCTEITLPSNDEWSFVCDLMSMNALKYDEWKNENFVEIVTIVLDAVMQEFIDKARNKKFLEKSVKFAEEHRALGIGVFGWHSLLQSKMIPFESMEAKYLNVELFKAIQTQAWAASGKLAEKFGEPAILEGYKRRNTTLTAVAPTTSSSFIIGQPSKSIEPEESNYFMQDLAKIHMPYRNPYLNKVFKEKFGSNGTKIEDAWMSVAHHQGSVQHLSFLTDHEKDVFKTFSEISPKEIIIQAAQRQKWIDQSQSLNLKIHPDSDPRQMHQLIVEGWELGIKTFYYQRSANAAHDSSKDLLQCRSCEA